MALGRQQAAEDAIEGERSWRIVDGYQRLPEYVAERARAAGVEIVFGAEVTGVAWGDGAQITCHDGREWQVRKVVVALPLAIVQEGRVRFEPEVPSVMTAARKLRMGQVCRFTCVFRKRLWPETMSFLLTPNQLPMVWWSVRPAETHSLTGWVGGPRSAELLQLSDDELKQQAITALATALEIDADTVSAELTGFHTHNWTADPWSRGAYSWVAVDGIEASAALSEPVAETLFFAGEHTDTTGHWGTVHAALRSGLRAGAQVVASMLGPQR
jgi:monoamine oxidase